MKNFQTDLDFALKSDSKDKLSRLTESFNFPLNNGDEYYPGGLNVK